MMIFGKDKNTINWVNEQVMEAERSKIGVHITTIAEAGIILKSMRFDAVLYDVSEPEDDVEETVKELLNICGKIPLIILTDAFTLPVAIDAVKFGADTYLVKDKAPKGLLADCLNIVIAKKREQLNRLIMAGYLKRKTKQ